MLNVLRHPDIYRICVKVILKENGAKAPYDGEIDPPAEAGGNANRAIHENNDSISLDEAGSNKLNCLNRAIHENNDSISLDETGSNKLNCLYRAIHFLNHFLL